MPGAAPTSPSRQPLLQRLAGVRPEEAPAVLWSMLYVVALFLAYYVLRPIRDELGVAGGVQNLPWLFTGTLLAMLVASPLFALAVRNLPRRQFIALAYRFFAVNLVLFALLLHFADPQWQVWVGRAFFIWVSVFNLFVVSVSGPSWWISSTASKASGCSACSLPAPRPAVCWARPSRPA